MSVDVEECLPLIFSGNPGVVTIAVDRFFPNQIPEQEKIPSVIWKRISGGPISVLQKTQSPIRRAMFQLESWAASQELARELDRAVQACFPIGGMAVGNWWIQVAKIQLDTDQDNPQIPITDDTRFFCSLSDLFVIYQPRT